MKLRLLLILAASVGISHAHDCNTLETLQTGSNEAATKIVNGQLLLEKVDLSKLGELGFKPLIGSNLDDWKIHNPKPEVQFTLVDGVISGSAENLKGNSFLYTTKEYDSYLLYFEFRFDHLKGNSGLMYHSKYNGAKKFAGIQYEMDPSKRQWTGLLYAENIGGWHYPNRDGAGGKDRASKEQMAKLSEAGRQAFNESGWNAGFIRIRGNEIQTWLNGKLRTNYTWEVPNFPGQGSIALQIHGGKSCAVSWRNLYLLPLEQDSSPAE
ncbi:MAG: 3-keto-disaccharide hydrolase [Akkermansiaceae bacterium]